MWRFVSKLLSVTVVLILFSATGFAAGPPPPPPPPNCPGCIPIDQGDVIMALAGMIFAYYTLRRTILSDSIIRTKNNQSHNNP